MSLYHRGASSGASFSNTYQAPHPVANMTPCKSEPYESTAGAGKEVRLLLLLIAS